METLHKLAGVQDAFDPRDESEPSQPVTSALAVDSQFSPPPPLPKDDIETRTGAANRALTPTHSRGASRASIPLNRKASHKSVRSQKRARSRSRDTRNHSTTDISTHDESIPPTPSIARPWTSGGDGTLTPRTVYEKDYGLVYPQQPSKDTNGGHQLGHIDDGEDSEGEEDFPWGPSHPCFPHPNPHCAPDSIEAQSTRVIRVKRDWLILGDLCPQYANLYPEILDSQVSDADFRLLIARVNSLSQAAFRPSTLAAWTDSLLGAFTGYLWDDIGLTAAKRGEKRLERYLDSWNREKSHEGKAVRVVQLRRTGFMSLDFIIPDPGIDGPEEDLGVAGS